MNNMNFDSLRRGQEAQAASNAALQLQQGSHQGADDNNLFGDGAALMHHVNQQRNNLTFTTQDAAQRSVMAVLARHNTSVEGEDEDIGDGKRMLQDSSRDDSKSSKKQRTASLLITDLDDVKDDPASVPAATEGISYFHDNDVLSGRGGGTNVHPGNRLFRDLINLHRRSYLKARKNDKPSISRAIVKEIRRHDGRFLKRDERSGLWFEIGDDAAREKTSQALRQRAPEMRKILFETERDHARHEVEDQLRQQQLFGLPQNGAPVDLSGLGGASLLSSQGLTNMLAAQQNQNHQMNMFNPLFSFQNKQNSLGQPDPYGHMSAQGLMTAALFGPNMNRFASNGA